MENMISSTYQGTPQMVTQLSYQPLSLEVRFDREWATTEQAERVSMIKALANCPKALQPRLKEEWLKARKLYGNADALFV